MITLMAFKDVRSCIVNMWRQGIHAFSVGFWLHFQQRGDVVRLVSKVMPLVASFQVENLLSA